MSLPRITPSSFTVEKWNGLMDTLEAFFAGVAGRGIFSGLAISIGTGLEVDFADGFTYAEGLNEIAADSITVPASSTSYLWLDAAGTPTITATPADPGGTNVCIGRCITDSSSVTSVSADGRVDLMRWDTIRDLCVGSGLLCLDLLNRSVKLGGALYLPAREESADHTVESSDYTIIMDSSGAARNVDLPASAGEIGRVLVVKRNGANSVSILADGSDTIDGSGTLALGTDKEVATIQCVAAGVWERLT